MRAADKSRAATRWVQPFFSSEHKAAREIVKAARWATLLPPKRWLIVAGVCWRNFVKKGERLAPGPRRHRRLRDHAALSSSGDVTPVTVSAFAG